MNTYMAPNEIQEIKDRLHQMEVSVGNLGVRFEERWDAHNLRSDDHWKNIEQFHTDIKSMVQTLSDRFGKLPCDARVATSKLDQKNYERDQGKIWDAIKAIAGSIVAVTLALVYAFINHTAGGK